ncbi:hypothetical protein [Streptomyces sp. NPDC001401]|uniref:hypothetical protein n=1 Tax=Streptomyces sp. NPDC001401 TaxID=3364570 RepID=UPI0036C13622
MTRLQLDNAARHVLRTAREAQAMVRGEYGTEDIEGILAELLLDFAALTGRPDLRRPAVRTPDQAEELIRLAMEAAVFVRAHNWHASDLQAILHEAGAPQEGPRAGERLVEEFLDGLGTLTLARSDDGANWEFRLLKEAAAGDESLTTAVKVARYLLDPSFLMLFGDTTELLGEAVYTTNVKRFTECVAGIEALTSPSESDVLRELGLETEEPDDAASVEDRGLTAHPRPRRTRRRVVNGLPDEQKPDVPRPKPEAPGPDSPGELRRRPDEGLSLDL